MPTPFMCHECDSPTMNASGVCDNCEQAFTEGKNEILATVTSLERRIRWLEDGLVEIRTEASELADGYQKIRGLINGVLDGEPTTADEFNEDCMITYVNEGDEVEYKYKEVGKRITFDTI